MKKLITTTLFALFLLAACAPAVTPQTPEPAKVTPAQTVEGCFITAHEFPRQDIPIPVTLLVNAPGVEGLSAYWRDGTFLGTWPTGNLFPSTMVHAASPLVDGSNATPLIFLGGNEDGTTSLRVSQGGEVRTLKDFPREVTITGLTGVPGQAWIAYSTVEPGADGSSLHSSIYLGEYQSIAGSAAVLTADSAEARILLPVAIHRDVNNTPDGIWYTYSLWGIGGDSLTDPRAGLYYLKLSTGESMEFLGMGCQFSSLSTGQNWAALTSEGVLHITELHSGVTNNIRPLPGNDRFAHVFISPGEGMLAWVEGKGWEYDGTLETTLRTATIDGAIISEFPVSAFAGPSGLGNEIAILPLGWLMPENEVLLVAVYSVSTGRASLVYVKIYEREITPLVSGTFAGFAYP